MTTIIKQRKLPLESTDRTIKQAEHYLRHWMFIDIARGSTTPMTGDTFLFHEQKETKEDHILITLTYNPEERMV